MKKECTCKNPIIENNMCEALCIKCNLLIQMEVPQTNNRIREEFDKWFEDETEYTATTSEISTWWLSKIAELLKSQKDRIFRRGYNQGVRCQIPYENLYAEALEDYQSKLKEE